MLPLAVGELVPEGRAAGVGLGRLRGGGDWSGLCLRMVKLLDVDRVAGTTGTSPSSAATAIVGGAAEAG